jgi:ketosteroid isomerase-like protein
MAGAGSGRRQSGILRVMPTNSELLLAGYDAWNHDDCEGWLELLHPEIEISTSGVFPDLAIAYRGRELAAKFWRQMHEPWETFRIDVERVDDEGDDVAVAAIRFRGKGADSGVDVDMRFGMAMRVQDGLAVQLVNRQTVEEARKAVSSPAAQPPAPLRRSQ